MIDVEGDFRQADHVYALAILGLGQGGGGGQPTGIAAHDLHNGCLLYTSYTGRRCSCSYPVRPW